MNAMQKPWRIAILGAESTGKSTLAEALATHFRTLWVPEYLREFVELHGRTPYEEEQLVIARVQTEREDAAALSASRFLFCDTTPLMTSLYSRFYWGRVEPRLERMAADRHYDLTLVTAPDAPWVADGLQRESEAVRQQIHTQLLAKLAALNLPYSLVSGTEPMRLQQVESLLQRLTPA
ncbi:AAA family ATPase [Noviherbaspirillum saxi]|uniref:Nicotinamide-nucleotide adenylyltransferase n=1 Tax=Noviherbaspirillum saxi TaxID=2320863 RepID=A0A3A3FJ35_9BURK|nr:ATP-binding protein [Noviherbaspirillum saxi]RJF95297.1 nicotinamide-nucleotide adenylyltransferase [Noviherbaspirillum saxi]